MKELAHLDCMGKEQRELIARDYNLKLIIYAKLLNGQTKRSDAHRNITDIYYQFECILKKDETVRKTITCGSGAGEHLIELAHIPKPQIFNPLKSELNGGSERGHTINSNLKWNPLAKELYNAIRWLICCWDIVPYGRLLNIKSGIEKYYYSEPYPNKIEYVNNILKNDRKGRTLTQMIDELRTKNNNIKDYSYKNINQILKDKDIKSYF